MEKMHLAIRNRAIDIDVCKDRFENFGKDEKPLKRSDRLGPLPETLMMHLVLDDQDFQMLNNLDYMPKYMRTRPRNPPFRRRLINPGTQKLSSGPSMAKCGDQQNSPPYSLKNGGILGELMKDSHYPDFRFVAPIEILLCLGCSQTVVLPKISTWAGMLLAMQSMRTMPLSV